MKGWKGGRMEGLEEWKSGGVENLEGGDVWTAQN